ncbi:MAG: lanthionine synthetase LanC family protein [Solirubrobacteraceae bacterium]
MPSDAPFLEACVTIARQIVADAVWAKGRCSWMGAVAEPELPWRAEYHALGPSLYGGTAGVGLFLAHVAAATGDDSARRSAVGALLHAASRATTLPAHRRDGFHAGVLGIAWAAVRAAILLEEEELHARAVALLPRLGGRYRPERCPDLVSGMAGSALGLLALARELDDRRLAEQACATGDMLIRRATVTSRGWSWAIPGRRYPAHLCGVSHGAAGIGWALLELFAATGDDRFRAGATGAFAYERSWLDRCAGRWPDLRIGGQRRGPLAAIDSGIAGTWCHGEAGIALTRLRAVAVLGPGPHCDDAEIALATTQLHLADALPHAINDLSLCHGLAGAADVLLGAAAFDPQWEQAADLAAQFGYVMLERYADTGQPWPCGTAGEITPALYLGLSGIGWLLLRLHEPGTPSPLGPTADVDTHARST